MLIFYVNHNLKDTWIFHQVGLSLKNVSRFTKYFLNISKITKG